MFASERKEVLARVPGGLEAIPPAVAWLEALAETTEGEDLFGLRDTFLTLALAEHAKLREAARFLWTREHAALVRKLRLPPVRRSVSEPAEQAVEDTEEVSLEPEVVEEAPLPEVAPTE